VTIVHGHILTLPVQLSPPWAADRTKAVLGLAFACLWKPWEIGIKKFFCSRLHFSIWALIFVVTSGKQVAPATCGIRCGGRMPATFFILNPRKPSLALSPFCALFWALYALCCSLHANFTLLSLSLQKERDVSAKPKQGEVKPAWMLHYADASFSMTGRGHSEQERGIQCGCFTTLTLRSAWQGNVIPSDSEESTHGCFTSFSTTGNVIPSVSEESTHGCFTAFSVTRQCHSKR